MLITEADLYLPISQQVLRQIIDGGADNLKEAISSLAAPEIASLLLIQDISKMKDKLPAYFERILKRTIDVLDFRLKRGELSSIKAEMVSGFDFRNAEEGYKLFPYFKIVLLDEEAIRDQNYLTFEGKWDYTFNERHRKKVMESLVRINNTTTGKIQTLTSEQSRLYREIKEQTDDHMHIQGYAGTGKSSLIKHLISMLDRKGIKVLILAERQKQIEALKAGIGQLGYVEAKTFAGLASEIIPQDLTSPTNRNIQRRSSSYAIMPDYEIIKHFNIMHSGNFIPSDIVKVIHHTIKRFCYSGDESIQLSHIPIWCISSLDEVTKQVVLHYAEELWKELLIPTSKEFKPPIRGYHRIKWAALNRWQIPADRYTHILIDECHDLAKSVLQILDNSPQAVISLGDEYQNLQGRSQQRTNVIRYREITHSVRSGWLLEKIVNPILIKHSSKAKAPFQGNQLNRLEITYYNKPQIPDKPAVILVNDMWGLFEWAQRIAFKNLNFNLLTDTKSLNTFVSDCIDLYRHGTLPRHVELAGFRDWNVVARRYYNNSQSFQQIDRMLRNNYRHEDWRETSAKFSRGDSQYYSLGRIADTRNHEFQTVMIIPEVVSPVWQADSEKLTTVSAAIYVAVTRAKECLILPEGLRNWIEEISSG